jgi:hypothetical protein
LAVGGIRLPRIAFPTALNTGENLPANATNPVNAFCTLYGTHIALEATKLKALYSSRATYIGEVKRVVEELVQRGFVLKEDAPRLVRNAQNDLGASASWKAHPH